MEYQISNFIENRTYTILHLGALCLCGSHAPLGRMVSVKSLRVSGLLQWHIKDRPGV